MNASPGEPRVPVARRFYALLRSNWISAAGSALVTLAFFAMVVAYVLMSVGVYDGPYAGIVTFLILPSCFALGLIVVPVGFLLYRNQLAERVQVLAARPVQWLPTLAVLTLVNVLIIAFAGYEGSHEMSSVQFCGTTCHSVMQPEYDAYFTSPHSEVACVACHVGSGASWYLKTKLNGVHQAIATLTDSYERPIRTPVEQLRSGHETCARCHERDRNLGNRLSVRWHFEENEATSPYANVLMLRLGGRDGDQQASGIHWHAFSGVEVTYAAATPDRSEIPWVEARYPDGTRRVFQREGVESASPPDPASLRSMDCVDCHNRASHVFDDLGEALDRELTAGHLSRKLPAIKQRATEILSGEWSRDEARSRIEERLGQAYPDAALKPQVTEAAQVLGDLWLRNVYPDRQVGFGSYPRLTRHEGCMRCHDNEHVDAEGRAISMDCTLCHAVLAFEESEPAVLGELGLEVLH